MNDSRIKPSNRPEIEKRDLTLRDMYSILRKRTKLIISTLGIFLFITFFLTLWQKPVYRSTTMISIEDSAQPLSLIPVSLLPGIPQNVSNEIELIKSRTLMELTIKELWSLPQWNNLYLFGTKAYDPQGLRRLVREIFTLGLWEPKPEHKLTYTETISDSLMADFLETIYKNLGISNPTGSEIITISYSSYDPVEAALIANIIAEHYQGQDQQWTANESSQLKEFVSAQLNTLESELNKVESELKDFQENERIFGLQDEAGIIMRELASIESEYYSKLAQANIAKEKKEFLFDQIMSNDKSLADQLVHSLNSRLIALRLEIAISEADLVRNSSLYGDDHEAVLSTKNKIRKLKENLILQTEELITQGIVVSDPLALRQAYVDTVIALEGVIVGIEGAANEYKTLVDQYTNQLYDLPEKSLHYMRLERERFILSETYKYLRQKHQEAQLNEAALLGKIRIVDPAIPPHRAVKPKLLKNLFLGLVFGIATSIALAFWKEYWSKSESI
jgi:uncharacterized protein involved in exopolysaccharide biosynthesis